MSRELEGARALIRAAHDYALPMERWLQALGEAARSLGEGPHGLGVMHAAVYRRGDDGHWSLLETGTQDAEVLAYMRRIGPMAPPHQLDTAMRRTPMFCRFSDWMRVNGIENFYREVPPPAIPLADHLGILARDGGREAVLVCGLHSGALSPTPAASPWNAAASHVISAFRLRRALGERPPGPDHAAAVVTAEGKVVHAEGEARTRSARERLRQEVAMRERHSSRRHAAEADPTVWAPLLAGEWTLVDAFDDGPRRLYVAMPNAPGFINPNELTPRERQVARLASHGLSNSEIAYALGIARSSVATTLTRALRKLGLTERTELPLLRESSVQPLPLSDTELALLSVDLRIPPVLSDAEGEVAVLAARGWTDQAIARRRDTSVRTVANQLRSVYRKLGVRARPELARRLAQPGDRLPDPP